MEHVLYAMLLMAGFGFVSLTHPVGMGATLIFHAVIVALITGLVGGSFWFSYILVLVYLGGVLVLFLYMTSLAANEKFNFTWYSVMFVMLTCFILFTAFFLNLPNAISISLSDTIIRSGGGLPETASLVMKLYSNFTYVMTVGLIAYLLFVLLVCVAIVGGYAGALRNFN